MTLENQTVSFEQEKATPSPSGLFADYFEEADLAKELRVTVKTLRRWARENRGPARRQISGNRVVYRRDLVREWLEGPSEGDKKALERSRAGVTSYKKYGNTKGVSRPPAAHR
jgi:hypothetical protein